MKKLVSAINLPLFVSGSIVIFALGALALFLVLNPVLAQSISDYVTRPFQSVVTQSSSVEIYSEQNTLRFKFNIQDKDKGSFMQISEKLEVGNAWQEGLGFGLEDSSMKQIEGYLPLKADVAVEGNVITLSGSVISFLPSAIVEDTVTFATDGATLRYASGYTNASVFMNQPVPLITYATASGKLNLSRKIESELFSIASKIDTIDLNLKGKSLEGKIVLK